MIGAAYAFKIILLNFQALMILFSENIILLIKIQF